MKIWNMLRKDWCFFSWTGLRVFWFQLPFRGNIFTFSTRLTLSPIQCAIYDAKMIRDILTTHQITFRVSSICQIDTQKFFRWKSEIFNLGKTCWISNVWLLDKVVVKGKKNMSTAILFCDKTNMSFNMLLCLHDSCCLIVLNKFLKYIHWDQRSCTALCITFRGVSSTNALKCLSISTFVVYRIMISRLFYLIPS